MENMEDNVNIQANNPEENVAINNNSQQNMTRKKSKKILIFGSILLLLAAILSAVIILRPQVYFNKAKKCLQQDDYQNAIIYFEKIKKNNDTAETYITYTNALISLQNGDYDNAINTLSQMKSFEKSSDYLNAAYYGKAEELFKESSYSEAKKYYEQAPDSEEKSQKIMACDFMNAENVFKNGDLLKAKSLYESFPSNYSFNGISVADRLKTLTDHADLVALCGQWRGSNGTFSVRQTHDSTGLWDQWDNTYYDYLILQCVINDNNTITIKGKASYYVYSNYSSLSKNLKTVEQSITFEETDTTIPSILYSSDSTTLKYDGSSFHLDFDYTNDSYSMNFTYRFKSSITYSIKEQ